MTATLRLPLRLIGLAFAFLLLSGAMSTVDGQAPRVRDLTINEGEIPVQLVGYGLVTGLDGTGDRVFGSREGNMTVRSIANLLRNMGIEVPEYVLRARNAAAVIVTAEASPYARPGGRFDVNVGSLGDATSLRGGVLLQTPMVGSVGGAPVAMADGVIVLPSRSDGRRDLVETSARLTDGGVVMAQLGTPPDGPPSRLHLKEPSLATAQLIVEAINAGLGGDVATLEDPGSVALQLPADDPFRALVTLGDLPVTPDVSPRVVVDARSGVVATGGDITVGAGVVSHDWLTVSIDEPDPAAAAADPNVPAELLPPGAVRMDSGVRVQLLAEALHAVGATAEVIGAVFQSLRDTGALHAEVLIR